MLPLFWVRHDRHLHSVFRITSDVSCYRTLILFYDTPHQCVVFTFRRFIVELHSEACLCIRSFCNNKQPRSILVYTVNQSHLWVVRVVCRNIPQMPCNSVHQCPVIVSASRMYH